MSTRVSVGGFPSKAALRSCVFLDKGCFFSVSQFCWAKMGVRAVSTSLGCYTCDMYGLFLKSDWNWRK